MNIFGPLRNFFDNGFYYPNGAILVLSFLVIITIGVVWIIRNVWHRLLRKIAKYTAKKNTEFIFVLILFIMVFTRFSGTYLNTQQRQMLPEAQYAMDRVGRDWLDGVMQPAFALLAKQPFNPAIGYGQSLTTVVGLIVSPLRSLGICTQSQIMNCSNSVYKVIFILAFVGFFLVAALSRYGKDMTSVLIIIITFYLGFSGSLGLDRGNLDIVFSFLIFVFAMLRLHRTSQTVTQTIVETIVLSFMVNTKLTIFPLTIAFLLTSGNIVFSLVVFTASFIGFSYLPLLFHSSASVMDSVIAANVFVNQFPNMFGFWCRPGNYVVYSLATYVIDCSSPVVSEYMHDYVWIIHVIGYILFFFIVIWPLRILAQYMWKQNFVKRLHIIYARGRQGLFLLILCLGTASINLLPFLSYSYRLYFSLACILAVWYAVEDTVPRYTIMLSSVFLLLYGLWVPASRALNILVALHYFYLITAAVAILLNQIAAPNRRIK